MHHTDIPDDDRELAAALNFDRGVEAAHAGVHELSAGFDDLPFEGCPEAWCEKPFAKIGWYEDGGEPGVGIPPRHGWTLAPDQSGTVLADLVERERERARPAPSVDDLLADPAASHWLKNTLRAALERDPVDAANEAEVLARALALHADELLAQHLARAPAPQVFPPALR